jgi:threonine/homoserine/homoserine lactone efflux protein
MSIAFLVTTLLMAATPGTGVVYTLSASISHGRRGGFIAAFGCTLGMLPHLAAAVTGLAAVMSASPVAFRALRYAGMAYLLYLAVATWRDRDAIAVTAQAAARSAHRIVGSAILVNLLNPTLTMFFFAFLPQFAADGSVATTAGLGGIAVLVTFVVFSAYGVLAATVRRHLAMRGAAVTWLRRLFAVSFVGLGLNLALTG